MQIKQIAQTVKDTDLFSSKRSRTFISNKPLTLHQPLRQNRANLRLLTPPVPGPLATHKLPLVVILKYTRAKHAPYSSFIFPTRISRLAASRQLANRALEISNKHDTQSTTCKQVHDTQARFKQEYITQARDKQDTQSTKSQVYKVG